MSSDYKQWLQFQKTAIDKVRQGFPSKDQRQHSILQKQPSVQIKYNDSIASDAEIARALTKLQVVAKSTIGVSTDRPILFRRVAECLSFPHFVRDP